jgi:hypothetical protein
MEEFEGEFEIARGRDVVDGDEDHDRRGHRAEGSPDAADQADAADVVDFVADADFVDNSPNAVFGNLSQEDLRALGDMRPEIFSEIGAIVKGFMVVDSNGELDTDWGPINKMLTVFIQVLAVDQVATENARSKTNDYYLKIATNVMKLVRTLPLKQTFMDNVLYHFPRDCDGGMDWPPAFMSQLKTLMEVVPPISFVKRQKLDELSPAIQQNHFFGSQTKEVFNQTRSRIMGRYMKHFKPLKSGETVGLLLAKIRMWSNRPDLYEKARAIVSRRAKSIKECNQRLYAKFKVFNDDGSENEELTWNAVRRYAPARRNVAAYQDPLTDDECTALVLAELEKLQKLFSWKTSYPPDWMAFVLAAEPNVASLGVITAFRNAAPEPSKDLTAAGSSSSGSSQGIVLLGRDMRRELNKSFGASASGSSKEPQESGIKRAHLQITVAEVPKTVEDQELENLKSLVEMCNTTGEDASEYKKEIIEILKKRRNAFRAAAAIPAIAAARAPNAAARVV